MDEQAIRILLEGGGGTSGALLRALLKIPGLIYGEIMRWRRAAYRRAVFSSYTAPLPVISVGNITAGGSGKTPMVLLLAEALALRSQRPGILLRGYRAQDGVSDEGELYRQANADLIVVEGADRFKAANKAAKLGATILLLDDGFQHCRLRRDFDLVLIDAMSPWGGGVPFPGGLLREPKSALRYADALIITRSDQVQPMQLDIIRQEIRRLAPGVPLFTACHLPNRLYKCDGENVPLSWLAGKKVVALCGIARPEAFLLTLEQLGATVAASHCFGDHRSLSDQELAAVVESAKKRQAIIVTTEKDAVKKNFRHYADNNNGNDVYVLGVSQAVDSIDSLIYAIMEKFQQRANAQDLQ